MSLRKDYLVMVLDPEEDEVIGIFLAPEENFSLKSLMQPVEMNQMQPEDMDPILPEAEEPEPEDGPDFYYPQDRELVRELRRKAMERERKKSFQERMLKWMMEK